MPRWSKPRRRWRPGAAEGASAACIRLQDALTLLRGCAMLGTEQPPASPRRTDMQALRVGIVASLLLLGTAQRVQAQCEPPPMAGENATSSGECEPPPV